MKQSWWKRTQSYFREVPIERISSELSPNLYVCLSQGRYQLCSNNAIYSFGDKYDNFWDTFAQLDVEEFNGKDFLILGFGLGSIPYMLEKYQDFKAYFTGVEYDEAVIYLFNKYMRDEIKSPLELITADGALFMEINERKFDVIAVDVFVDDEIPESFLEEDFLENLKCSLNPGGLIIWNHLYHYQKDRDKTNAFYKEVFKKHFPKGTSIRTQGNMMLLNRKINE